MTKVPIGAIGTVEELSISVGGPRFSIDRTLYVKLPI